jgi:hypothetical protein
MQAATADPAEAAGAQEFGRRLGYERRTLNSSIIVDRRPDESILRRCSLGYILWELVHSMVTAA